MTDARTNVEVERKWLLRRLPDRLAGKVGPGVSRIRIRQGYLPPVSPDDPAWAASESAGRDDVPVVGRIRLVEGETGRSFVHTLKSGSGMVRHEFERPISESAFDAAWPSTAGRRLEKTRWRIVEGGVCWEIDRIDGLDVVLLEAEIASIEAAKSLELPEWLRELVDREVTEEPGFTNAEMAFQSGLGGVIDVDGGSPSENR